MLAAMVDEEIWDFRLAKMVCLTHFKLPFSKLIFHSHNRIFGMCKSLKATYILLVTKLTYLNANKSEK